MLPLRSADDPKVGSPGADVVGVLPRQYARDLHHVIEVVRHPGRQQLAQRHDAKLGMTAAAIEIRGGQAQSRELAQAGLPQRREFVEPAGQRSLLRLCKLRKTIEGVEGARFAVLQNDSGARHPVGSLAVDQMSDDVEGAPRFASFVCRDPAVGKAAQQGVEGRGRSRQDGRGFFHHERSSRAIGRHVGHGAILRRAPNRANEPVAAGCERDEHKRHDQHEQRVFGEGRAAARRSIGLRVDNCNDVVPKQRYEQ
jgi:hypothetical protein